MDIDILYDIGENETAINKIIEGTSISGNGQLISIPYNLDNSYEPSPTCELSSMLSSLSSTCEEYQNVNVDNLRYLKLTSTDNPLIYTYAVIDASKPALVGAETCYQNEIISIVAINAATSRLTLSKTIGSCTNKNIQFTYGKLKLTSDSHDPTLYNYECPASALPIIGASTYNGSKIVTYTSSTATTGTVRLSKTIGNRTNENISFKTWTSHGCWQILDRINTYLYVINTHLSNINDILLDKSTQEAFVNNSYISLSSSPFGIIQNNTSFNLTETEDRSESTFSTLSSFYKTSSESLLLTADAFENTEYRLNVLTSLIFKDKHYRSLFLDQNIDISLNTNALLRNKLKIEYSCQSDEDSITHKKYTSLIEITDVLMILNLFLQKLKNIKKISISCYHKRSSNHTRIFASGKNKITLITVNGRVSTKKQGKHVSITISPFMKTITADVDAPIAILTTTASKELALYSSDSSSKQSVINLNGIIYDISSGASTGSILPVDAERSNGIFGYELDVQKQDNFKLTLQDIQKQYDIYSHKIISRKSILHAIDYIFQYWLNNMSTVNYNIVTCHANCHTNEVDSNFTGEKLESNAFVITGRIALHYTGGCGCSTVLDGSINLYNAVPLKHRTSSEYTLSFVNSAEGASKQYIYASVEIGGYVENTSRAPGVLEMTAGGTKTVLGNNPGVSSRTWFSTSSSINDSSQLVNFHSTKGSSTCDKENRFCIAVNVKAYYYLNKVVSS